MAEALKDVLESGQTEFYIRTMEPSDIINLGSASWFEFHEHIQKLHQQAIIEAKEMKEEAVKDMIISYNKIHVLVYEAICVSVWKEKVLSRLLNKQVKFQTTLVPYMILFHEATAIEFLEVLLYHADSCEALGETSLELIDYSVFALIKLLANKCNVDTTKVSDNFDTSESIKEKQLTLDFNIGIKCISIIGCIAQNLDSLPLSATTHIFSTHDIPIILTNLIENKPWMKKTSGKTLKFEDCTWKEIKDEENMKVTRTEAQTWLALHHLLLDPRCPAHYDINEYRKNQLIKLQCFLHENVMDQLSPLIELKYWLAQLACSNPPSPSQRPLILEVIPKIRQKILEKYSKRWNSVANKHAQLVCDTDENHMKAITQSLNEAYDLDKIEALVLTPKPCVGCGEPAERKCSRCKAPYCGRECQVKNWPQHKSSCDFVHLKTVLEVCIINAI
ncbi:hypothetical protein L9F63_002573 [Diploptera punctata]|uniref:MYND-type domain-containing protein n=1 Tax=Diploptera punctata TaxID=6984 RepID=A0AAD8ECV1_DIPPU|nr:hypothetical protein L9F63_002573 [Diploptera punctata]